MSELNNIPKHWQVKKLGEVCQIQTGKFDANHAKEKGKYRFYTCAYEHMYCDTNRFSGENLILPGNGANVGEVFYYSGEFDAYQRTYVINNIKTNPKFLYYHLLCYWKKRNQDKQFGSATNYIRIGNFNDYTVSFPPLPEQLAIVSKIEELLSDLENGKQQLLTAQQQLKVYRQSLLKAAFEGKLTSTVPSTSLREQLSEQGSSSEAEMKDGELPEGWKWMNLGDFISKIEAGKSFKCNERPPIMNEVGVLKVSAVTWGVYNEQESKTIIEKERYNEAYIVKDGDFLFSRANTLDLIGAAVIVGKTSKQLMLSDKTLRFIFNNQIDKYFVLYYLRSKKGRREIQRLSTGNQESMRNIGQARINQIEIPIPANLKEQHHIVEILESKLTVCDKIAETISQSLLQAETLKQSILKKAFEGKLV